MSGDQRPGRVRVVSSGRHSEPPHRRRGELAAEMPDLAPEGDVAPAPAPAAATPGASRAVMAMLFLVGCAMGGGLMAAFGLFDLGVA